MIVIMNNLDLLVYMFEAIKHLQCIISEIPHVDSQEVFF